MSAHTAILPIDFEKYTFKITATSPRGHWVKWKYGNAYVLPDEHFLFTVVYFE